MQEVEDEGYLCVWRVLPGTMYVDRTGAGRVVSHSRMRRACSFTHYMCHTTLHNKDHTKPPYHS